MSLRDPESNPTNETNVTNETIVRKIKNKKKKKKSKPTKTTSSKRPKKDNDAKRKGKPKKHKKRKHSKVSDSDSVASASASNSSSIATTSSSSSSSSTTGSENDARSRKRARKRKKQGVSRKRKTKPVKKTSSVSPNEEEDNATASHGESKRTKKKRTKKRTATTYKLNDDFVQSESEDEHNDFFYKSARGKKPLHNEDKTGEGDDEEEEDEEEDDGNVDRGLGEVEDEEDEEDEGGGFFADEASAADLMTVSPFQTPTCDIIFNMVTPALSVFKTAIDEMEAKWINRFLTPDSRVRMIPYILSNFGITYKPSTHTLEYRTTTAAVQSLERRDKGPKKPTRRRAAVGNAGPVQHVTVKNGEALELAMLSEVGLAYWLQAYVNNDHLCDGRADYARPKRHTMVHVLEVINNCHREAEHWFCAVKQVVDHVSDEVDEEEDEKMMNFPHFESGIQTRLRTLIEHMTPYRKVMIYLLRRCRKYNYRRHGSQLFQQKFIPTYTLKRHPVSNELICEECGKCESQHEKRDVARRPDCVFRPECYVDEEKMVSTFAWEPLPQHSEIGEFVRMQCRRHREPSMWFASLTDRDRLAQELSRTVGDTDLPIKPSFNNEWGLVISFRNGLYFVYFNQFMPYESINAGDLPNLATRYIDSWFHMDRLFNQLLGAPDHAKAHWPKQARFKNIVKLQACDKCGCESHRHNDTRCRSPVYSDICAECRQKETGCECVDEEGNPYFECYRVDVRKGLRDISTPYFDGILDHQLGSMPDYKDVYYWVWVMLGRWLFPLSREWDSWEKMLCLFGNAGTGKSCLLQILKYFVPPESATILSMNSQETFGLEALLGAQDEHLRAMVLECTGKFRIPAQQIQSMITGEGVSINRKNKRAFITANWTAHITIAGNAKPAWEDLGFALVRRILPIYMRVDVLLKDTLMTARINANTMDAIIFKLALSYLDASDMYRSRDLWAKDPFFSDGRRILPKTLIDFNNTIKTSMNPLFCMLNDGLGSCDKPMVLDPSGQMYITVAAFVEQYNAYCKVRFPSMQRHNFSPDIYTPVFSKFGLHVLDNVTRQFDNGTGSGPRLTTASFIVGVGFVDMFPAIARSIMAGEEVQNDDKMYDSDDDLDDGDDEEQEYLRATGSVPSGGIGGGSGSSGSAESSAANHRPQINLPPDTNPWDCFIDALRKQRGTNTQISQTQMHDMFALTSPNFDWSMILSLMQRASGRPDAQLTTAMIKELKSKFRLC